MYVKKNKKTQAESGAGGGAGSTPCWVGVDPTPARHPPPCPNRVKWGEEAGVESLLLLPPPLGHGWLTFLDTHFPPL